MPVPDTNARRLDYQAPGNELLGPVTEDLQEPTPQARRKFFVENDVQVDPNCDIPSTSVVVFDSNVSGWESVEIDFTYDEPASVGGPAIIPASLVNTGTTLQLAAPENIDFFAGSYRIARQIAYYSLGAAPEMQNFVVEFDVQLSLGSTIGFLYRGKPLIGGGHSVTRSHTYALVIFASNKLDPILSVGIDRGDGFQSENHASLNMQGHPEVCSHDDAEWYHIILKVFDTTHLACACDDVGFAFNPQKNVPNDQGDVDFFNYYVDQGTFGFLLYGGSDFANAYDAAAFANVKNMQISTYVPPLADGLNGSDPVCVVDVMQYA